MKARSRICPDSIAVLVLRLCIVAVAAQWMWAADWLSFTVAAVALGLTFIPALVVVDNGLRQLTSMVVTTLLAAHVVLGMHLQWYETSLRYDKVMHMLGSFAVALTIGAALHVYSSRELFRPSRVLTVTIVVAGTLAAGALWEIFEFSIDRTGLFSAQRGLEDTMLDLIADGGGALLASLFPALGVSVYPSRSSTVT